MTEPGHFEQRLTMAADVSASLRQLAETATPERAVQLIKAAEVHERGAKAMKGAK